MSMMGVKVIGPVTTQPDYNRRSQAGNFQAVLDAVSQRQSPNSPAETKSGGADSKAADKVGGGSASIDLSADLRQARESGRSLSQETIDKLYSRDTQTFVEGVSEATGRSPAQVMTALLNMNASQAMAFCKGLAKSAGCGPEAFIPMVSKLTGQPEAMMRQYLNGEDDEDGQGKSNSNEDRLQTAQTLDHQRDFFQAALSPSLL